jgi:hypothetical protein
MALKHHSTPLSGGDREARKKALGTPASEKPSL